MHTAIKISLILLATRLHIKLWIESLQMCVTGKSILTYVYIQKWQKKKKIRRAINGKPRMSLSEYKIWHLNCLARKLRQGLQQNGIYGTYSTKRLDDFLKGIIHN